MSVFVVNITNCPMIITDNRKKPIMRIKINEA